MTDWKDELHELFDGEQWERAQVIPQTRTWLEREQDFYEKVAVPALMELRQQLSPYGMADVRRLGLRGYLLLAFQPSNVMLSYSFDLKQVGPHIHVGSKIEIVDRQGHRLQKRNRLTRLPVQEPATAVSKDMIMRDFINQYRKLMRDWRGDRCELLFTHE